MANHCYNFVQFVGSPSSLHKLSKRLERITKQQIKEEYLDKGLPVPAYKQEVVWLNGSNAHELLFKKQPQSNFDVYDEYGSKWFDCYFQYNEHDDYLSMQGDSAWSPMLPLFSSICKKYKVTCEGNYAESGMDFAGEFVMDIDGNIEDNQMSYRYYEAKNNPDSFWEQIICDIEDGCFNSLDSVYDTFIEVDWKLTDIEKKELKEVYEKSVKENAG